MGPIRDLGMKVLNTKTQNVPVNEHFLDSLDNIKPSDNKTHYYNDIDKKVV